MKKLAQGFSLIELIVYCALCAFLSMMLMHWIVAIMNTNNKITRACDEYSNLAAALYYVQHDLMNACSLPKKIMVNDQLHYIWSRGACDVGWFVDNHKLMRCEGRFDTVHERWTTRTTNLIAVAINNFSLNIFTGGIPYCTCVIEGKCTQPMQRIVALRTDVCL